MKRFYLLCFPIELKLARRFESKQNYANRTQNDVSKVIELNTKRIMNFKM